MTSFGKLKIRSDDDDIVHSWINRIGQPTMIGNGKEKIASTSNNKSLEGMTMMDSTDTETTRTSRGRTHMDKLARHRVQGIRKEVRFNKLGQPVGEAAVEMQSYIGLLAREKVKITYKTWKRVPNEVKELIWESVNLSYDVPPIWKKGCLNSASNKWRQFKSHLTQAFISNNLDKPEELNEPPAGYGLTRDDWISFVITRMSDDFIKLSDQQKERRKKNIYPHRLSRKGYARYAEEIANELCDDDEINRAIIWKKGRINKEGEFDVQELKETVDKIDDYIQQKRDGTLQMKGAKKDILTKALNSGEHDGRVRAVGGHITPTLYFNVGRRWKTDDVDRELMIEQKRELVEARKLIQEQDTRIQKLEAIVYKKLSWGSDIDDKGSCSVKLPQQNDNEMKTDKTFPSYEEFNDVEMQVVDKSVALQGEPVILMLDYSTDIAAYGTVVEVNGVNHFLHGVPLPKNCMRVSIDEAMQKSARLPVPIPNECETIGDAVGTHVAWPKHLLVLRHEKRQTKKLVRVENNQSLSSSVPKSLRMVYCYFKRALENGRKLSISLDNEVFQNDCELNLHLEDISHLYHLEPISANCVVVYIWHLYKKIGERKQD